MDIVEQSNNSVPNSSIVRISNILNFTKQEFTLLEKHIFLNTLLKLKSLQGFNISLDNTVIEIILDSSELKETNKTRIKEAIDKITSRKIHFDRPFENKFGTIVPIPVAIYEKGNITLQILPIVKKIFLELANGYTEADLKAILNLNSSYAIRMYELMSMYVKNQNWTVSVEKLRILLNVESKYKDFRQFRIYILEYSQKELMEHCNIYFTWEVAAKKGKKVTALTFTIQKTEQNQKIELSEEIKQTIDFVAKLSPIEIAHTYNLIVTKYNLAQKQADYIFTDKNRLNEFIRVDLIIEDMITKGKPPKDRTKYLAKSLGLDKIKF